MSRNPKVIKIKKGKNKVIKIFGKEYLKPIEINVPGDPSSAAFFTALTILNQKSSIKIKNVGLNKTRLGFYQLLNNSGAKIKMIRKRNENNEPVGDILVKSSKIRPIRSTKEYYVNSTDEYPIMFVIAALTKGVSIFKGISDLANKESNRIKEMQKILSQVGIKSKSTKKELKIYGKERIYAQNKKVIVKNLGDHRICMSAFVLSVITESPLKLKILRLFLPHHLLFSK